MLKVHGACILFNVYSTSLQLQWLGALPLHLHEHESIIDLETFEVERKKTRNKEGIKERKICDDFSFDSFDQQKLFSMSLTNSLKSIRPSPL